MRAALVTRLKVSDGLFLTTAFHSVLLHILNQNSPLTYQINASLHQHALDEWVWHPTQNLNDVNPIKAWTSPTSSSEQNPFTLITLSLGAQHKNTDSENSFIAVVLLLKMLPTAFPQAILRSKSIELRLEVISQPLWVDWEAIQTLHLNFHISLLPLVKFLHLHNETTQI